VTINNNNTRRRRKREEKEEKREEEIEEEITTMNKTKRQRPLSPYQTGPSIGTIINL
jgi:hypothetical protein